MTKARRGRYAERPTSGGPMLRTTQRQEGSQLAYACPHEGCGAQPGQACRRPLGKDPGSYQKPMKSFHAERPKLGKASS